MYRGVGAAIVGGTPGTVLYLTSYDYFKSSLPPTLPPFLCHLSSGMLAEAFACIVYVPVDVVKERCQVSTLHSNPSYSTSLGALKHIMKNEGLKGVYRGYAATLLSFGPFSGLYFGFYEELKSRLHPLYPSSRDLPFAPTVATSVCAGLMAAWITTPLDLAKLRMQVVRGSSPSPASRPGGYETLAGSLRTIGGEGGVKGLWRGAAARCMFFAPATAVTMTTYDMFKGALS
ncbi:hypothetical protein TrRE_jg3510 [Triparma retinervis]|uniref:Mitochondrial carrier n=1 Tax=Triparma retinervis TaxID=2557542 RepID=A0A9W7FHL7_9STRA|nr:hypothetical protein TrRE_jg3510 [Triparma retinervis]